VPPESYLLGGAAVHALSHPLGGRYKVPHGLANSILLPVVMEFNASSNQEKFKEIAILLGENVEGLSSREAALRSVDAVKGLIADLDIPPTLGANNVSLSEEEIHIVAQEALDSGVAAANPKVTTLEDLKNILRKAL
jgi:alcohol dehydrogenase class IV